MQKFFKSQKLLSILLSVFLSFAFVFAVVQAATTVNTDITTAGNIWATSTIQVTGTFTAYNNATISFASTTVLSATVASTTILSASNASFGTLSVPFASTTAAISGTNANFTNFYGSLYPSLTQGWINVSDSGSGLTSSSSPTVNFIFATSTTQYSFFPFASTTALSATQFCLTGDTCRTTWPAGASGAVGWASSTATSNGSIYFSGNAYVGIGTTTPKWLLTISTTTVPQLALDSGAGNNQWTMRNAAGNLYFATTSNSSYATTTIPGLMIDSSGNVGIGGTTTPAAKFSVGGAAGDLTGNGFFSGKLTSTFASSSLLTVSSIASTTNFFTTYASSSQLTAYTYASSTSFYTSFASTTQLSTSGIASSTTLVTGFASTTQLSISGIASSTNLVAGTNIGIATSSPSGEVSALSAATTTLYLNSSTANRGGCIELKGVDNNYYRLWLGDPTTATTTGTGRAGYFAIFELGACK